MNQVPKQIGQYKILEMVGQGVYGKVYKAINRSNNEEVAMKFILKKDIKGGRKSSTELQSLKSQTEMLKKIDHENVIALRDVIQTETDIIIVMEYAQMDLGKLKDQKKKFSYSEVKKYSRQIFNALIYLREHRILHRDLKLQNILVHQDSVKLCDFGFAKKMATSNAFLQSMKGTPLYLAPQIFLHKPYNHKVDIWSFGIIIYELFFGQPPFYATNIKNLMAMVLHKKPTFPSTMPVQLRDVLRCMLQKNPSHRADWQDLKKHQFFIDQDEALRQIQNKIPNTIKKQVEKQQLYVPQLKKKVSQIEEIKIQVVQKTEAEEFCEMEEKLFSNKIVGNTLRTNHQFFCLIMSLFGKSIVSPEKVPKQIVGRILKVLTYLITKVKLNAQQAEQDAIKNDDLIYMILNVAQKQSDQQFLTQEVILIGYLLKNNFNYIQIDFDIEAQIMKLITDTLKNPNTSHKVFTNCLKVLGIIANQGMCTLNHSEQFFLEISQEKILSLIATRFKMTHQYFIVLELFQKFIHPITVKNGNGNTSNRMKTIFKTLREEVAKILYEKNFIMEQPPTEIFTKNSEIQCYMRILYQCLKVSPQMRKICLQKKYWNDFFMMKNIKLMVLACNYIIMENQNCCLLNNQTIQNALGSLENNMLSKVYIIRMAYFNLSKKSQLKQKIQMFKVILDQIRELLDIPSNTKLKYCQEVQGTFMANYLIFDQIIVRIICDIILLVQTEKQKNQTVQIVNGLTQIINAAQPILQNCLSFSETEKCPNLSQQAILMVLNCAQYYPKLRFSKKFTAKILQIFSFTIHQDNVDYLDEKFRQFPLYISKLIQNMRFLFSQNNKEVDERDVEKVLSDCEQHSFYRYLFSNNFIKSDPKVLATGYNFLNKLIAKYNANTYDFIAVQGMPKVQQYLDPLHSSYKNKNQSVDLIIELVSILSALARLKQEYYKAIEKTNIVEHIPSYLSSGTFNNTTCTYTPTHSPIKPSQNSNINDNSNLNNGSTSSSNGGNVLQEKVLSLVGNMAKHSTYFFPKFEHYKVITHLRKYVISPQNRNNKRIIRNITYAIGNIFFYDDRFIDEVYPLIPIFTQSLNLDDQYLLQNTISTVSNLLRHSDGCLRQLMDQGTLDKIMNIIVSSNNLKSMPHYLNFMRKPLKYEQFYNNKQVQQKLKQIYQLRKDNYGNHQGMQMIKKCLRI